MNEEQKGTDLCAPGTIWVCGACGKRARSRYGFDDANKSTALDRGWDESCMLNAVLCHEGGPPWEAVEDTPLVVEDDPELRKVLSDV